MGRNEEYIIEFGKNIKTIRTEKGFSQEHLAYDADIPINQIGRIERGKSILLFLIYLQLQML